MSKIIVIKNQGSYQQAYRESVDLYKSEGYVMLDFSGVNGISVEGGRVLFGPLLIKDKCGSITCKSIRHNDFVNIANGINEYFKQLYPQGIRTILGARITMPQIEMINGASWSTIQLNNEITELLNKQR